MSTARRLMVLLASTAAALVVRPERDHAVEIPSPPPPRLYTPRWARPSFRTDADHEAIAAAEAKRERRRLRDFINDAKRTGKTS